MKKCIFLGDVSDPFRRKTDPVRPKIQKNFHTFVSTNFEILINDFLMYLRHKNKQVFEIYHFFYDLGRFL